MFVVECKMNCIIVYWLNCCDFYVLFFCYGWGFGGVIMILYFGVGIFNVEIFCVEVKRCVVVEIDFKDCVRFLKFDF